MRYQEFKTNFLNNVYVPYISGDKGQARINLAKIYNDGTKAPRATKYQISSSMKDLSDFYDLTYKTLCETNQNERAFELSMNHLKFIKEVFESEHPLLQKAQNALAASMAKIYPSRKTLKLSQFIILKNRYPNFEKLKFLTKFL